MLKEMEKATGARGTGSNQHKKKEVALPKSHPTSTLKDIGITHRQSSQRQQLASIPAPEFERRLATRISEGRFKRGGRHRGEFLPTLRRLTTQVSLLQRLTIL